MVSQLLLTARQDVSVDRQGDSRAGRGAVRPRGSAEAMTRVSRGYHGVVSRQNDKGRKLVTCGRTVLIVCPREERTQKPMRADR